MRFIVASSYILLSLFVVGSARPTGHANPSPPANFAHSSANSVPSSPSSGPSSPGSGSSSPGSGSSSPELPPLSASPAPPANPAALVHANTGARRTGHTSVRINVSDLKYLGENVVASVHDVRSAVEFFHADRFVIRKGELVAVSASFAASQSGRWFRFHLAIAPLKAASSNGDHPVEPRFYSSHAYIKTLILLLTEHALVRRGIVLKDGDSFSFQEGELGNIWAIVPKENGFSFEGYVDHQLQRIFTGVVEPCDAECERRTGYVELQVQGENSTPDRINLLEERLTSGRINVMSRNYGKTVMAEPMRSTFSHMKNSSRLTSSHSVLISVKKSTQKCQLWHHWGRCNEDE
ncbi:hypothetical protein FB446DRAFT_834263 [Lentinula raphanica]|nr:hypothetical protein FB446DRAFT_834263 [Lentinula raphanica]